MVRKQSVMEEANIWKKCGGYGEVGGESLKELGPTFKRVSSF